ncbi:MAG: CDP-diacylglycerol--serine O-phosphatidyltransferase [Prevotellaceae bacterium]|nr:MAG: CDP-diacylglycerol--serine O-phosphatidyltransferase [Prevotellaceae bacterium]
MFNELKKSLPNGLTCCNLISGCIAVSYALGGNAQTALLFIIIGAVFDFFDGFSARALKVSSPIGKELDSLADDITFGFAPSAIAFMMLKQCAVPDSLLGAQKIYPYAAFVMAAFSALRLAKFNLDERQTSSFIGMPTPANALFWGALACSVNAELLASSAAAYIIILMVFGSSALLVSEIPMFALKFKNYSWKDNKVKYIFLALSLAVIIPFGIGGLAIAILLYLMLSLLTEKR